MINRFKPGPKPAPPPAPPPKLEAGRVTPDRPWPRHDGKQVVHRCSYCSRWSAGTQCDGCGAPIDLAPRQGRPLPNIPLNRIVK